MNLKTIQRIELPAAADMHVHMRQGDMLKLIAPTLLRGGVDTAFVMPNLVPPLTNIDRVLQYKKELEAEAPGVRFLMSLFLHASITPEIIAKAATAGIAGVKMYPQGGTTNSENGVADLTKFYDTFEAMEKHGMGGSESHDSLLLLLRVFNIAVLNLHGEVIEASAPPNTTLEEAFLPTLKSLHERFPKLRIVLEHCTTAAAVEVVKECGPTVAATITAHHLYLTSADACCDPFAFCKPIPKQPADRDVLLRTIAENNPKFFFGSDSAPHPLRSKTDAAPGKAPAGVFTQPYATQLVLMALEEGIERGVLGVADITEVKLSNFLSHNARRFYQLPKMSANKIVLQRKGETIAKSIRSPDGTVEVGNSRAGSEVFTLTWVKMV